MKKYLFFAILVANGVFTLNAQTKNELQIGLAMPQGDFADDNEDDAIYSGSGVAKTGFYLGYKLLVPIKIDSLYWTFSPGIMYNGLQEDFKDYIDDEMEDFDVDYTLPTYFNIPILAGLQYEKSLSDGFSLYGDAGVGLNILYITDLSYSTDNYEISETYDPSLKLGFKIGAGIVLQDKFTIGVNYMNLGKHKVEYEWEEKIYNSKNHDKDKFDKALSISSLNIIIGLRL